jgi:hypothetical protein
MADDDDCYAIDAHGNTVLIGLSAEETEEFIRLDDAISENAAPQQDPMDRCYGPRECRWLELYEKHETAKRRFLISRKTKH